MTGSTQNILPTPAPPDDPLPAQCSTSGGSQEEDATESIQCATSSASWPTSRYFPYIDAKPIRIKANMYVLQKANGEGNFNPKNPDEMAFLNDWFNKCNDVFTTLIIQSNNCSQTLYNGAKVEIIPNWIFYQDEYLWNNDNTQDAFKYPDTSPGVWHLHPFDLANHKSNPSALNVYLTASGSIYHQMVTLGTITDPNTGTGGNMPY